MNTTIAVREADVSRIGSVREAWIAAVRSSNVDNLMGLVTDDIAVIYGDCRCVCGKDALRAELSKGFGVFDFEQRDSSAEIIVHDNWALEFSEVESTVRAIGGDAQIQRHSRIIAVFARQSDASWRVARVIGLRG